MSEPSRFRSRWLFGHWCENQRKRVEQSLKQFGRAVRTHDEPIQKPTADEQANRLRRVSDPYNRDEDVKP